MSAVESIEAFARATGIFAAMNSKWGWPIAESLHFIGLALLIGSVGVFDLRLIGVGRSIAVGDLHRLIPWGIAGFALNVCTGVLFFVTAPDQYLYNPAFQLKAMCIALAGVNIAVFYTTAFAQVRTLPVAAQVPLAARVMAGVSLLSWIGVITFGRLLTFYRPPERWCFWC
jgi:hypothetical protein